ncbi:tripartite tricarboxylate transporter substrate binding protein [Roseomonas sp. OT10]|uniref:Bug family tripartite tricarboxylate transporter substrate binding protein n=1 Tax=Roseomonas cutis TaxID=2897332 RepID=UPI001E289F99|nr:tripartite tricarboxylate transporter substrate binding protein [Roseomonas sp. OT10]UFN50631.1 tripartite tricarboxylate transporter substrate binding protein [Roseomonas sp. OT10]
MTLDRRTTLAALAGAGLGPLALRPAAAQQAAGFPSRPVSVIVPFAPGGSTDFVARLLAQFLGTTMGGSFVVDNRAGASGTVGVAMLARARPDGHTLAVVPNGTFAMAPFLLPSLPYDNAKALAPIGMLASNAMFICVHPQSELKTLEDLIAAAKAQPGKLSFGSAGAGVANHLGVELLQEMAGIELLHVIYRSGAQGVQAVMAKEVTLSFVDSVTAIPSLKAGELRALAVTSKERSKQMPDVPTVAERGMPGYVATTDFGFFAPAGTPQPIIQALAENARKVMLSEEVRSKLEPLSIDVVGGMPDEFAAYYAAESQKWGDLIRRRNIKPE